MHNTNDSHHHGHAKRTWLYPQKGGEDANPKKFPETDTIFDHLKEANVEADAEKSILCLSMDARAMVKISPFVHGGKKISADQSC
jgi:hypothetical protein